MKKPTAAEVRTADLIRTTWVVLTDEPMEVALAPDFLSEKIKVKNTIKVHDKIEVVHTKSKYFLELLVTGLDVDLESISFVALRAIDVDAGIKVLADWSAGTVEYVNDILKWGIRVGNRVAKSGFESEQMAKVWLSTKQAIGQLA